MNEDVKEKWIAALESGEYKQGQLVLREPNSGHDAFCCLGVLCDLYIKETGVGIWRKTSCQVQEFILPDQEGDTAVPPTTVQKWAGITYDECESLAILNDVHRKTFEEIAQHIRENL